MNVAGHMLEARADARGVDHAPLALAIESLQDAVSAAVACGDACLSSDHDLDDCRECIQACADAADVAGTSARVLSRSGPTVEGSRALVDATAKILAETSALCADHGVEDKHARICADTLARAEQAMAGLQTAVAAASPGS